MKVCVIGGGGFIGLWVVQVLMEQGDSVVVMGRSDRPAALPDEVEYVAAAYGASDALAAVLERVDALVHLAYATVPSTSFSDPIFDLLANVPPTVALFQQAAAAGTGKLVLVSSGGTVYGNVESLPIREDAPTNPISPYGITKLTIERYAHMYQALKGLPVVIARPGNAYGVRRDGGAGGGFVTAAVRAAMKGTVLPVFGDGSAVRDYVHVRDMASGIVAALGHGVPGEIYNIGTGHGLSNDDVVRRVAEVGGLVPSEIDVRYQPFRGFDVVANVLDASRLQAVSGWRPRTTLDAGIRELWQVCAAAG